MTLEDFLRSKGHLLNKIALEEELQLPKRLLDKVINGDKKVPKKWREKITNFLKNLGNEIDN